MYVCWYIYRTNFLNMFCYFYACQPITVFLYPETKSVWCIHFYILCSQVKSSKENVESILCCSLPQKLSIMMVFGGAVVNLWRVHGLTYVSVESTSSVLVTWRWILCKKIEERKPTNCFFLCYRGFLFYYNLYYYIWIFMENQIFRFDDGGLTYFSVTCCNNNSKRACLQNQMCHYEVSMHIDTYWIQWPCMFVRPSVHVTSSSIFQH